MIRGTTPTHIFSKLPTLSSNITEIWVTYLQGGKPIITKEKTDITFVDDTVNETCTATVRLTQDDTLAFAPGTVNTQVRLLLADGTALASDEVSLVVKRIIQDGKIE